MKFDVRKNSNEMIDEIQFSDCREKDGSQVVLAYVIKKDDIERHGKPRVAIHDGQGEYVLINSIEHAENLMLGLKKAIELGWLK